jgi:hypothetical protein
MGGGYAAAAPTAAGPTLVEGTPQFGGQNYSSTHATQNWGIKDVPTPRQLVAQLDQWVIGQSPAKKVRRAAARRGAWWKVAGSCGSKRVRSRTVASCFRITPHCYFLILAFCHPIRDCQTLAVAVYNHFKRLQNKRQHMQRTQQASMPPGGANPNLLVRKAPAEGNDLTHSSASSCLSYRAKL